MQTIKEIIEEFIGALRKNSGSVSAHALRHAPIGSYKQASLHNTIAYLAVSNGGISNGDDVGYAVAIVYMLGHNSPEQNIGNVKFETVLKDIYASSSESTKKEIRSFIESPIDDAGLFWKRFFRFLHRNPTFVKQINCYSLADDLLRWNNDNSVRIKWAQNILD